MMRDDNPSSKIANAYLKMLQPKPVEPEPQEEVQPEVVEETPKEEDTE